MKDNKYIRFAGLTFRGLNKEDLLKDFDKIKFVVTVNAEFIVESGRNERLRNIINNNISTFDGQIPYVLAKLANRSKTFHKISGSSLIYDVCSYCRMHNKRLFLLGGSTDSNRMAQERLKSVYGIPIDGFSPDFHPYPFPPALNADLIKRIAAFKPDFLFVGFGVLKQEFWIDDHLDALEKLGVGLVVGCGGTFELASSRVKRAPVIVQKVGMESLFRFLMEPKWFRMKRILKSFLVFRYVLKK
ncbi:WecB/TagA/CpsF family glycosyltransferase [Chitinophaga sp. HK235]|uniref:WecB/TagA/CpsF family glycosyltransferase n=1 Tax=Chitinophaga sp. HK235 TaxID=2952571 RepID=UPI001BABEB07|nr:WecB/TagA/CpsF family glycosyltransferase [Chitinophaga sp. HK235]